MTSHVPADTDLLKVTAVISYTQFSPVRPTLAFPGPGTSAWRLLAYDWHDENRDGAAWRDLNRNSVVNAGEDAARRAEQADLRLQPQRQDGDRREQAAAALPRRADHRPAAPAEQPWLYPTSTVRLKMTTYRRQAWTFLTAPSGQINIPAGQTVSVTVSARVPAGTAIGGYEGKLAVDAVAGGGDSHVIVPVAINVQGDSLQTTFGGANGPARQHALRQRAHIGPAELVLEARLGRLAALLPEQQRTAVKHTRSCGPGVQWRNFPTDIDLILGGPAPWDWFSQRYPSLFGPYAIDGLAGSVWTNLGAAVAVADRHQHQRGVGGGPARPDRRCTRPCCTTSSTRAWSTRSRSRRR